MMQNFQYDLFLQLLEFNELSIIDYKIWDSLNLPQLEYYIFKRDMYYCDLLEKFIPNIGEASEL